MKMSDNDMPLSERDLARSKNGSDASNLIGRSASFQAGPLILSPRSTKDGNDVRLRLIAVVDGSGRYRCLSSSGDLKANFGHHADAAHSSYSNCEILSFRESVQVENIASAVLLFEAGPGCGAVDCRLLGREVLLDLYRPAPSYITLRLDPLDRCDLRQICAPLEITAIGQRNTHALGTQCVISSIYTDYPRARVRSDGVSRFKLHAAEWESGDNGDLLVNSGVCVLSNPQRTAVEVVCHEWAGLVILRRGPLLNAADLFSKHRCMGLIISETCDIMIGKSTGLGPGQSPYFGAFLDIFNP